MVFAGSVLFLFLSFTNCRVRSESTSASEQLPELADDSLGNEKDDSSAATLLRANLFRDHLWLVTSSKDESKDFPISLVDRASCGSDKLRFQVFLNSIFGQFSAHFALPIQSTLDQLEVSIDQQSILISLQDEPDLFKRTLEQACHSTSGSQPVKVEVANEFKTALRSVLERIAPDCSFGEPEESGWFCTLQQGSSELTLDSLKIIKKHMILNWQRYPYILSRKIALTEMLAEALLDRNASLPGYIDFDAFCNILQKSAISELPLSFAARRWQKAACSSQDGASRRLAANIGLKDALAEIRELNTFHEKSVKKGLLQLRIPTQKFKPPQASNSDIHLKLLIKPIEVSILRDGVELVINSENAENSSSWKRNLSEKTCWHPVYGERTNLLNVATLLKLVNSANAPSSCILMDQKTSSATEDAFLNPDVYLLKLLASETEFVTPNGTQKFLRLLPGTYKYNLERIPEDLVRLDQIEERTSGQILWNDKGNTKLIITEW